MLSFEPAHKNATKIADAWNKTKNSRFEIWYNPIYNSKESLVEISDKLPVLLSQIEYCLEKYSVTPETFRQVADDVAAGGSGTRLVRNKRMLHRYLTKHLAKVAKTELDFSDEQDDIELTLHLDTKRRGSLKSYVCLAVGQTGSGKSYTITNEYLLRDKNKANKRYFFFSAVPEDESLKNIIRYANRDSF